MKKMDKTCSNKYIPVEVSTQILANLPAKSLLRFRCVCKSWRSIMDNPYFLSMHRLVFNNSNSIKFVTLEALGLRVASVFLLTLPNSVWFRNITHSSNNGERYHHLHGICHSLLLVCCWQASVYGRLTLCNPSIRKSLAIPPCPFDSCFRHRYCTFVLGFARNIGDYKVIAIAFGSKLGLEVPKMRVMVYTLSDQQWAARDNDLNIDCLSDKHLIEPYYFCEGAAHWLGKDPYGNTSNHDDYTPTHLVSLDFNTESFTFLELPYELDQVDTISRSLFRSLFLIGESLATFCISPVNFKIWVLKQQSGKREWTLWFSGPSSSDGFNLFYYRRSKTNRVLYCESDGGCLVYKNLSYNIATGQVQSPGKSTSRSVERVKYSESLVLCDRDGTEDMV